MQEIGLYRLGAYSEIYRSYYNFETESIGIYKFKAPIPYLQEYHESKVEPSIHYLYAHLLKNREALAVYFANNTYIAVLSRWSITYINLYDSNDVEVYNFKQKLVVPEYKEIGYVKTRIECQSIYTEPYRLMCLNDHCFVNGKWIEVSGYTEDPLDIRDYALLLQTDKEACYRDIHGNLKLIGGE